MQKKIYTLIISLMSLFTLTAQTDTICIKKQIVNKRFKCVDCYTPDSPTKTKQINTNVQLADTLINQQNSPYIIPETKNNTKTLIGEYKSNNPYNGFFLNQKAGESEWTIYDFYKNGEIAYQLYNDFFNEILKKNYFDETLRKINRKNTFKNGILTDGVQVESIKLGSNRIYVFASRLKNKKTIQLQFALFALHYGNIITISQLENEYQLQDIYQNKINIRYTSDGKTMDYYPAAAVPPFSTQFTYTDIRKIRKDAKPIYYLKKGKYFYAATIENYDETFEKYKEWKYDTQFDNKLLDIISLQFPNTYYHISIQELIHFIQSHKWENNDPTRHLLSMGYKIVPGNKRNTYSIIPYDDNEKMIDKHPLNVQNKTAEELFKELKEKIL